MTRPIDPNSLQSRVQALVDKHGPCDIHALAEMLPDVAPDRIRMTVGNLLRDGRLLTSLPSRSLGRGKGSTSASYSVVRKTTGSPRRVASVFDLWRAV